MNLQLCFMNETASDGEGVGSEPKLSKSTSFASSGRSNASSRNSQPLHPYNARPLSVKKTQFDEKGILYTKILRLHIK